MLSPLRRRMLSSMPTRTCRPRAIPIVQRGITDRVIDSTNINEPCGRAASVFRQIERVGAIGTSADLHEVVDQRSHVDAGTDQALHGLHWGRLASMKWGWIS